MGCLRTLCVILLLFVGVAQGQVIYPYHKAHTTAPPSLAYDGNGVGVSAAAKDTMRITVYTSLDANIVYVGAITASQWNVIASLTVDGTNATLVEDIMRSDYLHLWLYKCNVGSATTHAVVIDMDIVTDMAGCAIAYKGKTGTGATNAEAQGNSTAPSLTISGANTGLAVAAEIGQTFTPDADNTVRVSVTDLGSQRKIYIVEKALTAPNATVSGTQSTGVWAIVGGSIY